ncbi:MAG: hypothetical protein H6618_06930 [Deltaproteobacteria bacterium]|nr:hypothetical protein [Deltaproteobacteria bacterium]
MNKNIVCLRGYRQKKKDKWLDKHHQKLTRVVSDFLSQHLNVSYMKVLEAYQSIRQGQSEESWDYTDLRDIIHQTIESRLCDQVYASLRTRNWFDARLFSRDDVIEYCLSFYITNSPDAIHSN